MLAILGKYIVQRVLAETFGYIESGHIIPGRVEEDPAALRIRAKDDLLHVCDQQPILLLVLAQSYLRLVLRSHISHGTEEIRLTPVGDPHHVDGSIVTAAILTTMPGLNGGIVRDQVSHERGQIISVPLRIPLGDMTWKLVSEIIAKHAEEDVIGVDQVAGKVKNMDTIGRLI